MLTSIGSSRCGSSTSAEPAPAGLSCPVIGRDGPQFSVCIRANERREGLRRAIASALDQDTDDLEVVVSEDSGDLEDVAAGFGDPRVRFHRNPGPHGSIANLRYVSSLARGEMVVVLDDDDRLLPSFLSVAGAPMERDESIGVVCTGFLREADGAVRPYRLPVPPGRIESPLRMILTGHPPGRSATLIRRVALEQGEHEFPLRPDGIGDLTTWLRAGAAGWGFWSVPEPLAVVSVRRGQMSASEPPARLIDTLERFEFDDPTAETARLDRLADARRRQALRLARHGRLSDARRELSDAAEIAPWPSPPRALASLAAHTPALHRLSVRHPRIGAALRRIHARLDPFPPR